MKNLLLLLMLLIVYSMSGQSINNQIISASGGSSTNGINSLDWTIGETLIGDFEQASIELHQGFHQVYVSSISTAVVTSNWEYDISISPNPTSNYLHIRSNDAAENINLVIVNVAGQSTHQITNISSNHKVDVSGLNNGIYFLKLFKGNESATYKFIKSSN